jgi:hypothetical protein
MPDLGQQQLGIVLRILDQQYAQKLLHKTGLREMAR